MTDLVDEIIFRWVIYIQLKPTCGPYGYVGNANATWWRTKENDVVFKFRTRYYINLYWFFNFFGELGMFNRVKCVTIVNLTAEVVQLLFPSLLYFNFKD